jgi:deoxyribose-phosphate aldolase
MASFFAMNQHHPDVLAVAKLLDHAVLQPTNGPAETLAGCELASKYEIAALCVKPCFLPLAARALKGSPVAPCAVTGFPHGNSSTSAKIFETREAIAAGATEIDTVINNGFVAEGLWEEVAREVAAIQAACVSDGAILKVIFETDFLNSEQIRKLAEICAAEGVAYVKTSTGFGYVKQADGAFNYRGATEEAVRIMRGVCGDRCGVKASGGIRTLDEVLKFRDLGCTRIGVGATAAILAEAEVRYAGVLNGTYPAAQGY